MDMIKMCGIFWQSGRETLMMSSMFGFSPSAGPGHTTYSGNVLLAYSEREMCSWLGSWETERLYMCCSLEPRSTLYKRSQFSRSDRKANITKLLPWFVPCWARYKDCERWILGMPRRREVCGKNWRSRGRNHDKAAGELLMMIHTAELGYASDAREGRRHGSLEP